MSASGSDPPRKASVTVGRWSRVDAGRWRRQRRDLYVNPLAVAVAVDVAWLALPSFLPFLTEGKKGRKEGRKDGACARERERGDFPLGQPASQPDSVGSVGRLCQRRPTGRGRPDSRRRDGLMASLKYRRAADRTTDQKRAPSGI